MQVLSQNLYSLLTIQYHINLMPKKTKNYLLKSEVRNEGPESN